jgi:hypothetical protein
MTQSIDRPRFRPGEVVDITIKAARVIDHNPTTDLIKVRVGDAESVVDLSGNATAERRAPAEWPPIPGDLWEAHRVRYFALGSDHEATQLMAASGATWPVEQILDLYGELALVHREPEQAGGAK